jgi:hypothetical protein
MSGSWNVSACVMKKAWDRVLSDGLTDLGLDLFRHTGSVSQTVWSWVAGVIWVPPVCNFMSVLIQMQNNQLPISTIEVPRIDTGIIAKYFAMPFLIGPGSESLDLNNGLNREGTPSHYLWWISANKLTMHRIRLPSFRIGDLNIIKGGSTRCVLPYAKFRMFDADHLIPFSW